MKAACRLGSAAIALLVVGGCLAPPEDVRVGVEAPAIVEAGESFTIVATVHNDAPTEQILTDLDVADEYLKGINIGASDPPFSDSMHIPIDNTRSYSFDLPIPPGGSISVTFEAVALHPGDYAGEIDFCINSDVSFVSSPVRTVVR